MDDPNYCFLCDGKGHSVGAPSCGTCGKGILPMEEVIEKFSKFGGPYIRPSDNKLPGIQMNSGSLGHGLPVCVRWRWRGKNG